MVRYGCDKESVRNPGRFLLLWVDSDDSLYFNMRLYVWFGVLLSSECQIQLAMFNKQMGKYISLELGRVIF